MCLKTMKNTIAKYDLIQNGDRIVIGVSGGADSVCLLYASGGGTDAGYLPGKKCIFVYHIQRDDSILILDGDEGTPESASPDLCVSLYVRCRDSFPHRRLGNVQRRYPDGAQRCSLRGQHCDIVHRLQKQKCAAADNH